jgi:hypothetical protein
MGYILAREMRAHLPEELALTFHLLYNHVPRVSLTFLPVVRAALLLARDGDYTSRLDLPTGHRLSVCAVIERFDLRAFLDEALA